MFWVWQGRRGRRSDWAKVSEKPGQWLQLGRGGARGWAVWIPWAPLCHSASTQPVPLVHPQQPFQHLHQGWLLFPRRPIPRKDLPVEQEGKATPRIRRALFFAKRKESSVMEGSLQPRPKVPRQLWP